MNIAFMLTDDTRCQAILLEAGLLGRITPQPKSNVAWCAFTWRGHWCLCQYDWDHEAPSDNGYTIVGIPQDACTLAEAKEFFIELMEAVKKPGGVNRYESLSPVGAN